MLTPRSCIEGPRADHLPVAQAALFHWRMVTAVVAVFTTVLSGASTCTTTWWVPTLAFFGTLTSNWKRSLRAS
jgi:hypothetical protein